MATSITRNLFTSLNRNFSTITRSKTVVERAPKSLVDKIEAITRERSFNYFGFHGTSKIRLNSERVFRMDDYSSACYSARETARADGSLPLVHFVGSNLQPKNHFMGYKLGPINAVILHTHQISSIKLD